MQEGNVIGSSGAVYVDLDLQAQRTYLETIPDNDWGLAVGAAFVRGIRDLGYKHTGTALDELIDNAIQANASDVHVALQAASDQVVSLAIIDNGHGMDPQMIRASVRWGGTHRENDRSGFGRYGYGEPSACVSQGRRFTVYSQVEQGEMHSVTIDVDDIGAGRYNDAQGHIVVPEAQPSSLPKWIADYISENLRGGDLSHGTIIVIEKMDKLSWKRPVHLKRTLMQHFGTIYRNFIREVTIVVDGTPVGPIDPLFLTEGFRFYDCDEDRAVPYPSLEIPVKDEEGRLQGTLKVRFSYMPPTFARIPKDKLKVKGGKANPRLNVMKDHNGLIITRNGRQIEVVTRTPYTVFQNNDRYWGCEIDFPATLDEEFSVTTAKQQIVPSERMFSILKEHGVFKAIAELRERYKKDKANLEALQDTDANQKRTSEMVMEDSEKFKSGRRRRSGTAKREAEGAEQFEQMVRRIARQRNLLDETVRKLLITEVEESPYKVCVEDLPGAPFYRVTQIGGQLTLYLNQAHLFYTDVYAGPDSTPFMRTALELLLFTLGDAELDAEKGSDKRLWYTVERNTWTEGLQIRLDRLEHYRNIHDGMPADDEAREAAENLREQLDNEETDDIENGDDDIDIDIEAEVAEV